MVFFVCREEVAYGPWGVQLVPQWSETSPRLRTTALENNVLIKDSFRHPALRLFFTNEGREDLAEAWDVALRARGKTRIWSIVNRAFCYCGTKNTLRTVYTTKEL